MDRIKIIFWIVALLFSLFYGTRATKIFSVSTNEMPFAWRFHQFWFNFLGSLVGWILASFFVSDIYNSILNDTKFDISLIRILILILAFTGMTGHLPFTLISVINYLKISFEKLFDKMK